MVAIAIVRICRITGALPLPVAPSPAEEMSAVVCSSNPSGASRSVVSRLTPTSMDLTSFPPMGIRDPARMCHSGRSPVATVSTKLRWFTTLPSEGKVVNQRSFVLTVATGERPEWHMRAGSRIPIGGNDVKSIDVGVNLDTTLLDAPDGLLLQTTADISSAGDGATGSGSAPVIRQIRTIAMATIQPNKPSLLFAIDDPASRHRFELEVTAVPQK